ncbi:hypothetical protein C0989_003145 [Termitomyces sp. Mn162]|nr:hypothetical protein C0989_003145 [Termitomyces sp. Mn162]
MSKSSVLLEVAQFKSTQTPPRFAYLSSQSYVLALVSLPGHYAASASAPANTIDIFDKTTLQGVQTLSGHDVATTSLHGVENIAGIFGRSLMSSGRDGSVKIWDTRTNSYSIKNGMTVAAGTEIQGEDALILYCTSNADETDEDEAVLHVGNWGCSISQAGWIQASSGVKIWAASDMETFSTWTHESNVLVTGGEDTKINVWPSLSPEVQSDDGAMDVDLNPRKRHLDQDDAQVGN